MPLYQRSHFFVKESSSEMSEPTDWDDRVPTLSNGLKANAEQYKQLTMFRNN